MNQPMQADQSGDPQFLDDKSSILNEVQCNIFAPHKLHSTIILGIKFKLSHLRLALHWISQLEVTSAADQLNCISDERACINLALSYNGYKLLSPANIPSGFPLFECETELHALLMLSHDDSIKLCSMADELEAFINEFAEFETLGGKIGGKQQLGKRLWRKKNSFAVSNKLPTIDPCHLEFVEHFRYVDGISQPRFFRAQCGNNNNQTPSDVNVAIDDNNGSYLAYQNFEQDPELFLVCTYNIAVILAALEASMMVRGSLNSISPRIWSVGEIDRIVSELETKKLFSEVDLLDLKSLEFWFEAGIRNRTGLPLPANQRIFHKVSDTQFFNDNFRNYLNYAGALLFGRFTNGCPIIEKSGSGSGINNFTFNEDRGGRLCPLHAHIRRMNPRLEKNPIVPPLIRRGVPYGPPLGDKASSVNSLNDLLKAYGSRSNKEVYSVTQPPTRGLHFLGYTSNLEIFDNLRAKGNAPHGIEYPDDREGSGTIPSESVDAIIGSRAASPDFQFCIPAEPNLKVRMKLQLGTDRLVREVYTGYFYAPSISTLKSFGATLA